MEHSFDVEIAQKVGINAAIIYKHIQFWCAKNKANDKHFYDGYYWTYNSTKAFAELFPYLANKEVRQAISYAINKLVEANLIAKAKYNKQNYDQTLWYTDFTILSNQDDKLVKPIPYNKQQIVNNNDISKDISSEQPSEFQFGKSKPKKPNLYQNCIALINDFTDIESIHTLLVQYLDLCMELKYIKGKNQWKGMLNTLDKVQVKCHPHTYEEIIQNSIDHAWKTFYPINDNISNKKDFSVKRDIEKIGSYDDYDKYDHTKSERSF